MANANSQPVLKYSQGFNLPFNGDKLLDNFDFISLRNGQTTVTAEKASLNSGGGATSIQAPGGVKVFNQGTPSPQSTVSFKQGGTSFFTTPTAGTNQSVQVTTQGGAGKLKVTQGGQTNTESLGTKIANWTVNEWLLAGGAIAGAFLVWYLVRK